MPTPAPARACRDYPSSAIAEMIRRDPPNVGGRSITPCTRGCKTALSGHLTGPLTKGVFMSPPARATAGPVPDTTANARFPAIWHAGQRCGITSPRHRRHCRTTVTQTGHKTGHSACQNAVSYSEKPLSVRLLTACSITPFGNASHHFRRLFDDIRTLFVPIAARTYCYYGKHQHIRSWAADFTNRSENRSQTRARLGPR